MSRDGSDAVLVPVRVTGNGGLCTGLDGDIGTGTEPASQGP